jgi:hypothetical protein
MAHAMVGYLFVDTPENGGKGFLIGFNTCQSYKVAERRINHTTIDPVTGKQKRKGNPLKHNVGDAVLVDCAVRGSDVGTTSNPKFSLKLLWEHVLLPSLDSMVAIGGPAEGATVVHQEDNASPHQEGTFRAFLEELFEKKACRLELQAPQGPYTNVLDLHLFPSMSKHHSRLLQMFINTVAVHDKIWRIAENAMCGRVAQVPW